MSIVAINGRLLDGVNIGLTVRDRGFLLGDGVFETLLAFNRVALWREDHLARMRASAEACGIAFPGALISQTLDDVLKRSSTGAHAVRCTLSRGPSARGLASDSKDTTLIVSSDPFDAGLSGKPVTLATAAVRRSGSAFTDRHKTLSYINNVVAARAAAAAGAEDALMLTEAGHVACTTIANVFLVRGGHLVTPPLDDGVLNGTMRQALIKAHGAEIRSIGVAEMAEAEAAFICNSLRLIRPISTLDGRPLKTQSVARFLNSLLEEVLRQSGASLMEMLS